MIIDLKQYEQEDLTGKGEYRKRHSMYYDEYKKYAIYKYLRGHDIRYGVFLKTDTETQLVEVEDLDEAKEYIDKVLEQDHGEEI